jgi:hypothetical protein
MSKEIGVLFPLFVLAWELIIRRSKTIQLDLFARILATAIGFVVITALVYMVVTQAQWLLTGYTTRNFSLYERLLTEGRVLWFYLSLMLFPRIQSFALHHDDILLSTGFLSPWTTIPSLLGLAALAWLAWRSRQTAPLLSFGISWFLIGHSLESTLLPLEIAHEHRNYLPSFGLAIIASWALSRAMEHPGWKKTLGISIAVGMMAGFAITTALRSHQFGDELRRTQIEVQHHPKSIRANYEAAAAMVNHLEITNAESPGYYFAYKHYETVGKLSPTFKLGWLGMIHLNCQVKKPPKKVWINELSNRLHHTTFEVSDRNLLYNVKEMSIVGTLCLSRNEIERLFAAAINNSTTANYVKAILYSWLADYMMLAAHDLPAAQSKLNKSLAIEPNSPSNLLKWSQLAFLQGNYEEALKVINRIKDMTLTRSEKGTLQSLVNCIDNNEDTLCTLSPSSSKQN